MREIQAIRSLQLRQNPLTVPAGFERPNMPPGYHRSWSRPREERKTIPERPVNEQTKVRRSKGLVIPEQQLEDVRLIDGVFRRVWHGARLQVSLAIVAKFIDDEGVSARHFFQLLAADEIVLAVSAGVIVTGPGGPTRRNNAPVQIGRVKIRFIGCRVSVDKIPARNRVVLSSTGENRSCSTSWR